MNTTTAARARILKDLENTYGPARCDVVPGAYDILVATAATMTDAELSAFGYTVMAVTARARKTHGFTRPWPQKARGGAS